MLAKLIPTRVHAVLDYLFGVLFLVLPHLLEWSPTATWLMMSIGLGILVLSLLTNYELGVLKWIPVPFHLGVDLLVGLVLLGASLLTLREATSAPAGYLILGLVFLIVALLTNTQPGRILTERAQRSAGLTE
jgi:hypothetical protein